MEKAAPIYSGQERDHFPFLPSYFFSNYFFLLSSVLGKALKTIVGPDSRRPTRSITTDAGLKMSRRNGTSTGKNCPPRPYPLTSPNTRRCSMNNKLNKPRHDPLYSQQTRIYKRSQNFHRNSPPRSRSSHITDIIKWAFIGPFLGMKSHE